MLIEKKNKVIIPKVERGNYFTVWNLIIISSLDPITTNWLSDFEEFKKINLILLVNPVRQPSSDWTLSDNRPVLSVLTLLHKMFIAHRPSAPRQVCSQARSFVTFVPTPQKTTPLLLIRRLYVHLQGYALAVGN